MQFEEFVATRQRDLLRFSTTLTNDQALGEDLVQDILIRAHARWDRITELDQPYTYVRRMLVNEFISWRRKWARIVPRADLTGMQDEPGDVDHAARHANRDAMQRDIARLPRRQRAVIVLRYYEQLSDDEIAKVLGCTPSTIRGYAMRALQALRISQTNDATPVATDRRTR